MSPGQPVSTKASCNEHPLQPRPGSSESIMTLTHLMLALPDTLVPANKHWCWAHFLCQTLSIYYKEAYFGVRLWQAFIDVRSFELYLCKGLFRDTRCLHSVH